MQSVERGVSVASAIGVVPAGRHLALMVEQGVQHAQRLAGGGMPEDGIDRAVRLAPEHPYWNLRPLEEGGCAA